MYRTVLVKSISEAYTCKLDVVHILESMAKAES